MSRNESHAQTALLALLVFAWTSPAVGQTTAPADPEVARVRTEFEYGNYAEALKRASDRVDRGNLSDAEVIELHKYAGLAAFYLNRKAEATRHLWALLQLDPDYSLDPFVVPPPAVAYFDTLRKERAPQLDSIRAERRRRAERLQAEAEREQARAEAEQHRRRLEELARRATLSRVETRNFAVNFIPFGAGQFQQGRTRAGVAFAATEGVLAITSIVAFLAYNSLIQERLITVDDRLTPQGTFTFTERGIPPERQTQANVWRGIKYGSAGAFWLAYGVGVVDAIVHHQAEVVRSVPIARGSQAIGEDVEPKKPAERGSPRPHLSPTAGPLGARLVLSF